MLNAYTETGGKRLRQTIVLASSSPRRRALLEQMGIPFITRVQSADEHTDEPPERAVGLLAERKARAVAEQLAGGLVLGADTLVALDGRALGKPRDAEDAREMLGKLSGRVHDVYTGVCLLDAATGRTAVHVERTAVTFRALAEAEIAAYIDGGEPMDKAGAYAIQGGAGAFVSAIEGSYSNVMGLPVEALTQMMADWEAGEP